MKTNIRCRAFTGLEILVAVVILGLVGYGATKTIPAFNGDARRAAKGEQTTAALIKSADALGSAQTASANVIGEAAANLPPSPDSAFILNEVPIMLARGPAPDPKQIIAARDRRIAYLEGRVDAQEKLTKAALSDAGKARDELAATKADKQKSDEASTIAAAEKLAANRVSIALFFLLAVVVAAYLYLKKNTIGLDAIGELRAMTIKGEKTVEDALDGIVPRELWAKVKGYADKHFTAEDFKS